MGAAIVSVLNAPADDAGQGRSLARRHWRRRFRIPPVKHIATGVLLAIGAAMIVRQRRWRDTRSTFVKKHRNMALGVAGSGKVRAERRLGRYRRHLIKLYFTGDRFS